MKKKTKHTLLKGEGINQHTLYGKFSISENKEGYTDLLVAEESVLQHETPSGQFAEHNSLKIEKGEWAMGKQVEYNPFTSKITRVWD